MKYFNSNSKNSLPPILSFIDLILVKFQLFTLFCHENKIPMRMQLFTQDFFDFRLDIGETVRLYSSSLSCLCDLNDGKTDNS